MTSADWTLLQQIGTVEGTIAKWQNQLGIWQRLLGSGQMTAAQAAGANVQVEVLEGNIAQAEQYLRYLEGLTEEQFAALQAQEAAQLGEQLRAAQQAADGLQQGVRIAVRPPPGSPPPTVPNTPTVAGTPAAGEGAVAGSEGAAAGSEGAVAAGEGGAAATEAGVAAAETGAAAAETGVVVAETGVAVAEAGAGVAAAEAGGGVAASVAVAGGSWVLGPVGLLVGAGVLLLAGGWYLTHRGGSTPPHAQNGAVAAAASTMATPAGKPGSLVSGLDTKFSQPQYLIHATGHGTYGGVEKDDFYVLFPFAPDARGFYRVADGSGGTYTYSSDYHSGPYSYPHEVCGAAAGFKTHTFNQWNDDRNIFSCG